MACKLVLCFRIHEPLPLRLPADVIPSSADADELESRLFDLDAAEEAFTVTIAEAYGSALGKLGTLATAGLPLSLVASEGFLELAGRWSPPLLRKAHELLALPEVEAVCGEPREGLLFAFDIAAFMREMSRARAHLAEAAAHTSSAAAVSGYSLNHELYHALGRLGFAAIAAESEPYTRAGHHPARPSRWGNGPTVVHRLTWLSDELGYRLRAGVDQVEGMADTIAALPGEVALCTFDLRDVSLSAQGPERAADIAAELADACARRGVEPALLTEAGEAARPRAPDSPPPVETATAGPWTERRAADGWWDGLIFGRMQQSYQAARLTKDPAIARSAHWLLQRANLAIAGWAEDPSARPATYRAAPWWDGHPNSHETAAQVLAAYDSFIQWSTDRVGRQELR